MPALEFSAADVLHVDAPIVKVPSLLPIAVVNDNTLTSNELSIDLYTGAQLLTLGRRSVISHASRLVSATALPPLHSACLSGDFAAVKQLCKEAGLASSHDSNVRPVFLSRPPPT